MAKYIEIDSLEKDGWYLERFVTGCDYACIENKKLGDLPAEDVAPVLRGRWEPSDIFKGYYTCSVCHDCYIDPEWVNLTKWSFCPACGADLRKRDEE